MAPRKIKVSSSSSAPKTSRQAERTEEQAGPSNRQAKRTEEQAGPSNDSPKRLRYDPTSPSLEKRDYPYITQVVQKKTLRSLRCMDKDDDDEEFCGFKTLETKFHGDWVKCQIQDLHRIIDEGMLQPALFEVYSDDVYISSDSEEMSIDIGHGAAT